MALRVARGCDDVATTRPCVRVPGVRVARLAGFDPKARSDLRSGQRRADTHGGASSATGARSGELRRGSCAYLVPPDCTKSRAEVLVVLQKVPLLFCRKFLGTFRFAESSFVVLQKVPDVTWQLMFKFESAGRPSRSGREPGQRPLCHWGSASTRTQPSSAVRTARCVLRRIVCRVVKTHSRTVVAGTLQQQKQHHHD